MSRPIGGRTDNWRTEHTGVLSQPKAEPQKAAAMIKGISAITLATHDMARAVSFYRKLGFTLLYGGEDANFTSFRAGENYLNLILQPAGRQWSWWGRLIFYDSNVDALHTRLEAAGFRPEAPPRDAAWGERFFHIKDPDGHELSFAWPLPHDAGNAQKDSFASRSPTHGN